MKLLVVGHSYVTSFAQAKYAAMKRLDPALQLRIVTPPDIGHFAARQTHRRHDGLRADEAVPIRRVFGRSHMTYVLDPRRLGQLMAEFAPTHVHIEEDPHALAGVETVMLAHRAAAPILSFFIWDNLHREPRFPMGLVKRVLTGYALHRADLVVCGNREAERLLRGPKGFRGRTLVAPQVGLDPEAYAAPPDPSVRAKFPAGDAPLIGFLGRLVPEKGLQTLFDALRSLLHLPWRLAVVGDGPLKRTVRDEWPAAFGD